ncbi:hypothetical protein M409DRAFT_23092 [Zasmidium cellare ATCC 36951]|uniref:Protein BIG1 n=1 Tax=Zasmidium cellare ATCC 36951 TaxID=1080233 RepID=A0A6A6CKJ9_ZASCE|nr:uncharacterized protein M409DRAFT_23092 [Zasmidium cellare ATCC 36951]KAF2166452.1 hypothetical protein M409DRAFT_23092 [Zasmidium cellare ATCC 36951]
MLIRSCTALLLAASTAYALKDAYPFVLLSTEAIPSTILQSTQLSTASSLQTSLLATLDALDANTQFIFIEQGGVAANDLRDGSAMPKLRRRIEDKQYKSVVQVPEVLGGVDLQNVVEKVGGERAEVVVVPGVLGSESVEGRRQVLGDTDASIENTLSERLSNHTSHVIIYVSVPFAHETSEDVKQQQDYRMDEPPFHEVMHTDLKRDLERGLRRRQDSGNDDFQRDLPLFEKYQFLTPGIFMGLSVSILLFGILYVGISAIAGLEVSYMAFSKEMGPQAQGQKKQQ